MLSYLQTRWPEIFGLNRGVLQGNGAAVPYAAGRIVTAHLVGHDPGKPPTLYVTLDSGDQYAMMLSGPALYSLNRQLAALLSPWLNPKGQPMPDGGGGKR